MARVRTLTADELGSLEASRLRDLLDAAWTNKGATFSDDDWASATGGVHVLLEVDEQIVAHASVGALDTGNVGFYERLGWRVWKGPTSVRTERGPVCPPGEDRHILVHLTPRSPALDMAATIGGGRRCGDIS